MSLGDPRPIFKLVDLSGYMDEVLKGWITVMGQSERGEVGVAVPCYGPEDYREKCGNTVEWSTDPAAVLTMLENKAHVVFIRLVHYEDVTDPSTMTAKSAGTLIPDRGGIPLAGYVRSAPGPFLFLPPRPGSVAALAIGPYSFQADAVDTIKLRVGVPAAWGPEQTVTFPSGVRTAQDVCDDINAQTAGLNAVVTDGKPVLTAIAAGHDIELLSVADDAYSTLSLNIGTYAHAPGSTTLVLSIDAGADQSFTFVPSGGETGAFSLTAAQVAAQMAGLTGAVAAVDQGRLRITSVTTGEASSVQCKTGSSALGVLGLDTEPYVGSAGEVRHPWRYELKGPGKYGNGARIYVYDNKLASGIRVDVRITIPGAQEQNWDDLSCDPDDVRYWKNWINAHDQFGRIVDVDDPNPAPQDRPAVSTMGYALSGGDDGDLVLTDADYIGDPLARTGMYALDKNFAMPSIDVIGIGTSSAVVHHKLAQYVDSRCGLMGHGQTPPDMSPERTVMWRNGDPPEFTHAPFDSPSFSLTFGRAEVFDARNNGKVSVPGTAFLGAAISRTDVNQGPHMSPFGVKRGRCSGVLGIDYNVAEDPAAADLFAEYGINSLRILRDHVRQKGWEGAVLWGGLTSQINPTALRELPVMRLIKTYERMLIPILLGYVFDPNHPVTWREIHRIIEPYFRREADKYAVYGYFVQTDKDAFFSGGELKGAVLNTGLDIDQGKYRMRILIQPTRQMRFPTAEMGVMRTGEPYSRYSEMYELPGWVRN